MRRLLTLLLVLVAASGFAGGPAAGGGSGGFGGGAKAIGPTFQELCGQSPAGSTPAAPDAPTLTVAGVTTDTISLTCTTPTGATSFEWDVSESAGFESSRMVLTATTTTAAALSVTGQPAGVALWARVRAVGPGGTSSNSGAASGTLVDRNLNATPTMVLDLGNAPANFSGGATGLWVAAVGENAIQTTAGSVPSASGSSVAFRSSDGLITAVSLTAGATYSFFIDSIPSTNPAVYPVAFDGTDATYRAAAIINPTSTVGVYRTGAAGCDTTATVSQYLRQVISFNLPVSGNTPVWIGGAKKTTTGNVADSKTVGLTIGNAYDLNVNRFWGDIYRFRIFLGGLSDAQLASTPLWLDAPPRGPDLAPITASTTTSLVASWTHLTGVSSYRLDVATDPAMLTGYLPGYQSRIVATSSAGGLTIDATGYTGQTVYLRMRSAGAGGIGPSTATTAAVIP